MEEVESRFNDFVNLLKKRTIDPIANTAIKDSCTATLLLLFAAVDSLSKITCTDSEYCSYKKKKGNRERFIGFLDKVMCNKYAARREDIYELESKL